MKFNREKMTALLALAIFLLGVASVVRGFVSPIQSIAVPEARVSEATRKILPKKYRTYTEESESTRNPFAFSEGWQRMETTPLALPPVPPAPRPVPLLWPGATAFDAGLLWQDKPPVDAGDKAEGGGL